MSKEPNTRLTDLFALSGFTKGELARLVNRQAAAMGCTQLATDTSRVRRWMETGESPRDPVPRALAALFTERLGRVVTVEDLGFGRQRRAGSGRPDCPEADPLPWAPERTAVVLTEFTGMDLMLNRRALTGAGATLSSGAALTGALGDWLTAPRPAPHIAAVSALVPRTLIHQVPTPVPTAAPTLEHPGHAEYFGPSEQFEPFGQSDPFARSERTEATPVGAEEVTALERSVDVFRAWDASRGGGLQRKAVIGQLNEVGGMLEYRGQPEPLRRRLWGVAANLAVLAGWMSHDIGLEPTAQRYFVIAVHAAKESGDDPRAGEALSRAARQMIHLNRPADAAELMRLAHRTCRRRALPRTRSMLHTVDAWAQAALGDGRRCRAALGAAEEEFAAGATAPAPPWMRLFGEADLHGMQALALRTLADHEPQAAGPAREHASKALKLRAAQGRERSAIFDRISMASACCISGEPEQAAEHARFALAESRQVSSRRTWDRLHEMYRLTARYAEYPDLRELREEISEAMPAAERRRGARTHGG